MPLEQTPYNSILPRMLRLSLKNQVVQVTRFPRRTHTHTLMSISSTNWVSQFLPRFSSSICCDLVHFSCPPQHQAAMTSSGVPSVWFLLYLSLYSTRSSYHRAHNLYVHFIQSALSNLTIILLALQFLSTFFCLFHRKTTHTSHQTDLSCD